MLSDVSTTVHAHTNMNLEIQDCEGTLMSAHNFSAGLHFVYYSCECIHGHMNCLLHTSANTRTCSMHIRTHMSSKLSLYIFICCIHTCASAILLSYSQQLCTSVIFSALSEFMLRKTNCTSNVPRSNRRSTPASGPRPHTPSHRE